MEFNTNEYVASHGKEPRGTGMWAFSEHRNSEPNRQLFWFNGYYGEAKKAARAHYKALSYKVYTVYVQP